MITIQLFLFGGTVFYIINYEADMQKKLFFLLNRIQLLSATKLCLLLLVINILITSVFSFVLFPEPEYGNNLNSYAIWEKVVLLLIVAPLAETYIFQKMFLEAAIELTKRKWLSVILIAVLFGLAHWYSVPYMVKTFISGLLYCFLYLTIQNRKMSGYWYTAGTHMAFNFVALMVNIFE